MFKMRIEPKAHRRVQREDPLILFHLVAARLQLTPLRLGDFPEHMRGPFRELMEEIPKSEQPYFRDARRVKLARALLSLYTRLRVSMECFRMPSETDLDIHSLSAHGATRPMKRRSVK
jgi:hypothetical protein